MAAADGVLFACPEYNGSVSGPLKNAIDWASRSPNVWDMKPVAIMGAGGGGGTSKAQMHLRDIALVVNALVLNKSVQVQARYPITYITTVLAVRVACLHALSLRLSVVAQAFTPGNCDLATGELSSPEARKRVADLVAALAAWVTRLAPK